MSLFGTVSSSTFIILDVRSKYTPSQIQDWYREENSSRDRQTVFFTAVNPMHKNHQDPIELDLTKPRLASYKQKWKVHQDTVYRVNFQHAQRKGLKFYQTRRNAVILNDTLPAYCISKAIVMKSEEIIYHTLVCHVDHRRRFPLKIIGRVNWILMLQEAVSHPTNRIKTQYPITRYKETCYKTEWRNPGTYQVWSRHS